MSLRSRHLSTSLPAMVWIIAGCLWTGTVNSTERSQVLSENEYLAEIPMVYSASRLPQQPRDSAGAITVIDRDLIRKSGARDVTDLFRLVPGFQVGISSGGRPVVSYHGMSGQVSQRMQVYIDGRSLYAPYLFGGVDWSSVNVPLDEIERIEIQRGSNSVTYGANAFLGVIHIVTRVAAQSLGWYAQVTQGDNGISDRYVRWGQSQPAAQWRLSAGSKSDNGLIGRVDPYVIDYLDLRAELQPAANQEISLLAGITRSSFSSGFEGRISDPLRVEDAGSSFVNARFKHTVNPNQEWSLSYSHTRDSGGDSFSVPLSEGNALTIDSSRKATRDTFEYQQYNELAAGWRASWGVEFQQTSVMSRQLFNTTELQSNSSWRAYVNQEWKPSPSWTANIGGLWEHDQLAPAQFAPRLGISWKPTADQTFKIGYSSAFRTPSLFEQRSNWRIESEGQTLDVRYLSRGGLIPERINAWDLVYIFDNPKTGLTFDTRLFKENIEKLITGELYLLPPEDAFITNAVAYDLRNNARATSTGLEYQLTWHPQPQSTFILSQYFARNAASRAAVLAAIPQRSTSLLASHTWGNGWTTGLTYSQISAMNWLGESTSSGEQRLVTMRLGRSFRLSDTNVKVAATWRRPIGRNDEFRELQSIPKQFWITLSAEY